MFGALISVGSVLSLLVLVAGCADAKWPLSAAVVPVPPPVLPPQADASVGSAGAGIGEALNDTAPDGVISRNEPVVNTIGDTPLTPGWTIHTADYWKDDKKKEPTLDFGNSAKKTKIVAERNPRAGENNDYRLSLKSVLPEQPERASIGQSRAGQLPAGLFAMDTSMGFGSAASIQMKTSTRRWDDFVEDDPFRLWMDDGFDWERNGVSDSHIAIGLAENRLRFTTRYSRSNYAAGARYLRRLAEKDGRDDEDSPARFDGRNRLEADAMLNRLDVDVARTNVFRLSLFGQHSEIDPYYEDIASRDRKDDFSESNEEKDRWGGTVGVGPVALTLAQYRSRKIESLDDEEDDDDTSPLPRTVGNEAKLAIDLSDARRRLSDIFGDTAWSVLPKSMWFGIGRGAVDTGLDGEPQDRIEEWDAGMSWHWDSGYGSISAWQSTYQMQQDWTQGGGSQATGVDVSLGLWRDTWGIDGYLSAGRYEYEDPYYQSGDTDFGGGIYVWAKFENFPDLSANSYLSHYRGEYDSSGHGVSLGRFGVLSVVADMSKYLTDLPEKQRPSLQLLYRVNYDQYEDRYEADSSSSDALDHIFGVKLRMTF